MTTTHECISNVPSLACGCCNKPILEERLIAMYAGRGINRNKPQSWIPLHYSHPLAWRPGCSDIMNIEDDSAGFLEMTVAEYRACQAAKIPRRVHDKLHEPVPQVPYWDGMKLHDPKTYESKKKK